MRPFLFAVLGSTIAASAVAAQATPPKTPKSGLPNSRSPTPREGQRQAHRDVARVQEHGRYPLREHPVSGNKFPGLEWTAGPAGTKTYVVIMQDTDILRNGAPILHWSMVDIPASTTKLAAGMTDAPAGTMYGPNIRGTMQPYMGPRTPAGPKHRYHLQVFALDTSVGNESMQSYDAMLAAMKGHVLASGEIIGLGSAPAK
jgi:para-nitrobenzyl esterase